MLHNRVIQNLTVISLCNSDTLSSYSSSATSSRRLKWYFSCSSSCVFYLSKISKVLVYCSIFIKKFQRTLLHKHSIHIFITFVVKLRMKNCNLLKLHPFRPSLNGGPGVWVALQWINIGERERLVLTGAHYEGWILAVALGKPPEQHCIQYFFVVKHQYLLVLAKAIGRWVPPPGPCCGLVVAPLVSHLVLASQRKHPNPTSFCPAKWAPFKDWRECS